MLAAETWDPATAKWAVGASEAVYRGYHSTATLLQDGAGELAGDESNAKHERNHQ